MKKSSFVALVLGTISSMFLAIGMCMAMLPQWNAFKPGCLIGVIGLNLWFVTVAVWRKMEHKMPLRLNGKTVLKILLGIVGLLTLGVGMCFTMVWSNLIVGIVIGMIGLIILLSLVPICIGIK